MAPLSCGAFNNQTKGCWLEEKESSTLWIDLEHFPIVFSKNIAAGNSQEMTEQWNTDFDNSFENVTSWHWPPPTNAMAILHSPSLWDICFSTRLRTMSPVPVNICHLSYCGFWINWKFLLHSLCPQGPAVLMVVIDFHWRENGSSVNVHMVQFDLISCTFCRPLTALWARKDFVLWWWQWTWSEVIQREVLQLILRLKEHLLK